MKGGIDLQTKHTKSNFRFKTPMLNKKQISYPRPNMLALWQSFAFLMVLLDGSIKRWTILIERAGPEMVHLCDRRPLNGACFWGGYIGKEAFFYSGSTQCQL